MKRRAGYVWICLAALWFSAAAPAMTTCSATMTNLSFGTVDPTSSLVNTSATLSYSCTFTPGFLGGLNVSYTSLCFSIGSGSQSTSFTPRIMKDTASDAMSFQIYTDAARSVTWGSLYATGIPPAQMNLQIGANATQNGSLTVYGQVPAGQSALVAGGYQTTFSAANAQLNYAYYESLLGIGGYPASCTSGQSGTGTGNFAFNASATVQTSCKINTTSDLNFGSVAGLITSNVDQTTSIGITCVNNTPWQLGLDNGQNASGTTRRMTVGGNFVTYELYRDSNRTLRWGNTLNSDTLVGTGTGTMQSWTVYGRVLVQTAVPGTGYTDKITVTVTY